MRPRSRLDGISPGQLHARVREATGGREPLALAEFGIRHVFADLPNPI
jgi:hypothetical protein